jgi:hypothetical protein
MPNRYGDMTSMWSLINLTMSNKAKMRAVDVSCSMLLCQAHSTDYYPSSDRRRRRTRSSSKQNASPPLRQLCRFPPHSSSISSSRSTTAEEDATTRRYANSQLPIRNVVFHDKMSSDSWSSKSSLKSCFKSASTNSSSSGTDSSKHVSFDYIEIKEHPRILGDNPSPKKGPSLSIGWFKPNAGRIHRYSVDEYENQRAPWRRHHAKALSPTVRQRLLIQEAGVTVTEIFAARKEASLIRQSRREHNILSPYDDNTAIVMESCVRTVKRLLTTGSISEWELRELMQQAERAKLQQQ